MHRGKIPSMHWIIKKRLYSIVCYMARRFFVFNITVLLLCMFIAETSFAQSSYYDEHNIVGENHNRRKAISTSALSKYFNDYACTELKSEYKTLSDSQLRTKLQQDGLDNTVVAFVLKIKNNTWEEYEKEFRIATYKAHSDAFTWHEKAKTTGLSYMGNPTGIYSNRDEYLYVFVDSDIPEGAKLYLGDCPDFELVCSHDDGTPLHKGVNVVRARGDESLHYVLYTADTTQKNKRLSEWPEIKIHIEGGTVNGYYDNEEQNDAKYRALLAKATHTLFTVKGRNVIFNLHAKTYRDIWPNSIDMPIKNYDKAVEDELSLIGIYAPVAEGKKNVAPYYLNGGEALYPYYVNNPFFLVQGKPSDPGLANSTPLRVSIGLNGDPDGDPYYFIKAGLDVTFKDYSVWTIGHENGHNNQEALLFRGLTESSNNLFANLLCFVNGHMETGGMSWSHTLDDFQNKKSWFERDIWSTTRMFFQLYLYYHQAQRNTSFYPELFKALREDPLGFDGDANNTSLKLVRTICKVANEDLTDFFRLWGFFVPFDGDVDDYEIKRQFVRQEDIDKTLAEISKYPRKNRAIMFIDDRVKTMYQSNLNDVTGLNDPTKLRVKNAIFDTSAQSGDLGQFTDYADGFTPSNYYHIQTDNVFKVVGDGGVGFIITDDEDNMLCVENTKEFTLPQSIVKGKFNIYSVDPDGSQHIVPFKSSGLLHVNMTQAGTLGKELKGKSFISLKISGDINGSDIAIIHLLEKNKMIVSLDLQDANIVDGGSGLTKTTANTIGNGMFKGSMLSSILLPKSLTKIEDEAFAECDAITSIVIPDNVTYVGGDAFAYCDRLREVTIGSSVVSLDQGVFWNSPVENVYARQTKAPIKAAYLFGSNPTIHVYASAYSSFISRNWGEFGTVVGDLEDESVDGVIKVSTAGTLAQKLEGYSSDVLRISGEINGTDIAVIRDLEQSGKIVTLDLEDAKIVAGGTTIKTTANTIGEKMFYASKLSSIVLPKSLTKIGKQAFAECDALERIVIPDNVTFVGMDAFAYCDNLKEVTIGANVTSFEQGVFWSSSVENAYVRHQNAPVAPAYLFSTSPTIHVYASAYDSFISKNWREHGIVVGDLEDETVVGSDEIITVSTVNYSSYYNSQSAVKLPAGVKGYTVTLVDGKINLNEAYNGNGTNNIVPKGEPIVINAVSGDYTLNHTTTNVRSRKSMGQNILDGTDSAIDLSTLGDSNDYYHYALSINQSSGRTSVGFYWMNNTGGPFVNGAHKAFLRIVKTTPTLNAKSSGFPFLDDIATSIHDTPTDREQNSAFNFVGQKVDARIKGLVIVNGKKHFNK